MGIRIRLQDRPFQILQALLENPGELVTREELRARLWSEDTFVDFDNGLNAAVNKVRDALGDSAENPRYIETLARRGYRFIAPVRGAEPVAAPAPIETNRAPEASAPRMETPPALPSAFRLAQWVVRPRLNLISKDGREERLEPKVMQVLLCLVEHRGEGVSKDELLQSVWAGTFVGEEVLTKCISELRKIFADDARAPRVIETIPKMGYRLIAPIEPLDFTPAGATSAGAAPPVPRARRSRRRLIALAFAALALAAVTTYFALSRRAAMSQSGKLMLAVLPFEKLSNDQEYLSDGMTEELINQLGRLRPEKLGVIARTSSMTFKGSQKTAAQIGRELGVDYLVEGSIRREGNRVRISSELIQARDQTQLWAENYDRDAGDLLSLETEVALSIAGSIRKDLLPPSSRAPASVNAAAYEAYLRGRYFWNKGTLAGYETAQRYFEEAVAKDPKYAPAFAGLAQTYNMMGYWLFVPPKQAFPEARQQALKARALDPDLADAHAALAYALLEYDWDLAAAESEFQHALALDPNSALTHQWYGLYLADAGRSSEGEREIRIARQLDPLSLQVALTEAAASYYLRRYDDAARQLRSALEMDAGFEPAYHLLYAVLSQQGKNDDAVAAALRGLELSGVHADALMPLERAYKTDGIAGYRRAEAELLESQSKSTYVPAVMIAMDYAAVGDADAAFAWLQKAYAERSGWLLELKLDPAWDRIRSDPRFDALLARLHPSQ